MTTSEVDDSQSIQEDASGVGGPGAPTPLSALEVILLLLAPLMAQSNVRTGCRRSDEERYPTDC